MLAGKFVSYRLPTAGITQHKLKCRNALISLWSLKAGKVLARLDQNEEKKEKKINVKK